jgi:hypothetical protein
MHVDVEPLGTVEVSPMVRWQWRQQQSLRKLVKLMQIESKLLFMGIYES